MGERKRLKPLFPDIFGFKIRPFLSDKYPNVLVKPRWPILANEPIGRKEFDSFFSVKVLIAKQVMMFIKAEHFSLNLS